MSRGARLRGVCASTRVVVLVCSVALGGLTVTALLPLCDLLFSCGCEWPWAGGIDHCNIFEDGQPHCPWCLYPRTADLSLAAILAAQVLGVWAVAHRGSGMLAPLLGGVLGGAAAAVAARRVVAWWAGYPL